MRVSALASILAMTLIASSCDSPLKKAKDEAILKLSDDDPILLKEIVLENLEVESAELGSEAIDVEGGTIFAVTPDSRLPNERGIALEFPGFSAQVVKFAAGQDFSSLPPSWGVDDLDKMRFICGASQRTIDAATDLNELKEAVARLTARGTIAPFWAFDRLAWIEGDQFSGLLSGDFAESTWMELLFRPAAKPDVNYLIQFRRKDGAAHEDVLAFMRSLAFKPNAEQGASGQPATAGESK